MASSESNALNNAKLPPELVEIMPGFVQYVGPLPFDQLPIEDTERPDAADDFEWALNDPDVEKHYSGQVVAVYRRRVWGAGRSHGEALANAQLQAGCPRGDDLQFVWLPALPGQRNGRTK